MRKGQLDLFKVILKETRKKEKQIGMKKHGEPYLDCDEAAEVCLSLMKKRGIKGKVVVGSVRGQSHAWVESGGMIIDPTADQFKLPKLSSIAKASIYRRSG